MDRRVLIDYHPRCRASWGEAWGVVVVDVIRATTTATTGVAAGRRCFPVASVNEALRVARELERPLLVGELGGERPAGFDMTNSPAELAGRPDVDRPMVLLSSAGTQLLERVKRCASVYVGCFRNHRALVRHLAAAHRRVAVLGAGTRGEFREEDQMCCAWIAGGLVRQGFVPDDEQTEAWVERWAGAPRDAFLASRSVEYLRRSGQLHDLEFILGHFDDLEAVPALRGGEIAPLSGAGASRRRHAHR